MRAIIGTLLFVQFFVFAFFPEWIQDYISDLEYSNVFEGGRSLYWFEDKGAISIFSLILMIKGCHLLWTSNLHSFIVRWSAWGYSGDSSNAKYKNIERVRNYRNSGMSLMTNEDAAKEYKQTAWLDGVENYSGKNAERAKAYIDSTLNLKDNESAIKWLKEK